MELYTYDEVAAILKVTRNTIMVWVRQGILTPIKLGGKTTRFTKEEIERFINGK